MGAGWGGVKALSLAVTDGFFPLFSLSFPKRLGLISSFISNRVLCLYELIKDGRKQREGTSNRAAASVTDGSLYERRYCSFTERVLDGMPLSQFCVELF